MTNIPSAIFRSRPALVWSDRRTEQATLALAYAAIGALIALQCAQLIGLRFGSPDDIIQSLASGRGGVLTWSAHLAVWQRRVYYFVTAPLYYATIQLAETGWYDVLNISMFALGSSLPVMALRRALPPRFVPAYLLAYWGFFPLLWDFTPPLAYPTFMYVPLVLLAAAIFFLDRYAITERCGWFAASAGVFFLSLASYELFFIVNTAFYAFAAWKLLPRRSFADLRRAREIRLLAALPLAYLSLYCIWYLGTRLIIGPGGYSGNTPSALDPIAVMQVVARWSGSGSIWFYFFNPPAPLTYLDAASQTISQWPIDLGLRHLLLDGPLFAHLLAGMAAVSLVLCLRAIPLRRDLGLLVLLGGVVTVGGVVLYGFMTKYRLLSNAEDAYVGSRFSYIGVTILLCVAGVLVLHWTRRQSWSRAVGPVGLGCLFYVGVLAATETTAETARNARMHSAKWQAVTAVLSCRSDALPTLPQTIIAPELWSYAWLASHYTDWALAQIPELRDYWSNWIRQQFGASITVLRDRPAAAAAAIGELGYTLDADGRLQTVTLAIEGRGDIGRDRVVLVRNGGGIAGLKASAEIEGAADCGNGFQLRRGSVP